MRFLEVFGVFGCFLQVFKRFSGVFGPELVWGLEVFWGFKNQIWPKKVLSGPNDSRHICTVQKQFTHD